MVLGRFEVCNVTFERKLLFYNNNYQIVITSSGPEKDIIDSMPQYFEINSSNCGNEKVWDFDKQAQFYQDLVDGKGSDVAQDWFNTFDDIISTIEISEISDNSSLIQGKWISIDDQNSTIEFKDKTKIDFYAGEKMTQGVFKLEENDQHLIVTVDEDIFEYTIVELSDNILTLTYLSRGNTLKYQR